MKKLLLMIFLLIPIFLFTKIPNIPEEYIIFEKANNGYDLYIKKMDGIESILLTESQKDPLLKKINYGLRTLKFHPCNGNEIRILNGKILHTKYDLYFLVDSTTESHSKLGKVFHFFIPEKVVYGYSWISEGYLEIKPGITINMRLFQKKYADYSQEFKDQWIVLKLKIFEKKFNSNLIKDFTELSEYTEGDIKIKTDDDKLEEIFSEYIPDHVPATSSGDIVFIIDATLSMRDDIPIFQKEYPGLKQKLVEKIKDLNIGLIFYRDYGDDFLTRVYDVTNNLINIDNMIKQIKIDGGDDVPEAVNEAIVELKNIGFKSDTRIIFIIGDAPAHPIPRGKITRKDALQILKETRVKVNSICLPYN